MTDELTHMDEAGNVRMVDVGEKPPTARRAVAEAAVLMAPSTRERLFADDLPKGDAVATVRIEPVAGSLPAEEIARGEAAWRRLRDTYAATGAGGGE